MTDHADRLPTTTARAIVVAALVATLALATHDVRIVGGVLSGLVLAAMFRGFAGSRWRVALVSGALPTAVFVPIAGLGGADSTGAGVAIVGVVGLTIGFVATEWPTEPELRRAGAAALSGAVGAGVVAILLFRAATAGGVGSALAAVLQGTGDGLFGLSVAIVVPGAAVIAAVFAVPMAVSGQSDREAAQSVRNGLAVLTIIAVIGLLLLLPITVAIAAVLPSGVSLLLGIADSIAVRGLFATVTLCGLLVAVLGVAVRLSWRRTTGGGNAIAPILAGAVVGIAAFALGTVGVAVRTGSIDVVLSRVTATALVLGAGWLALWWWAEIFETVGTPDPAFVTATALVAGGVAIQTSGDPVVGLDAVRTGLPSLVAIAAGLFVYDVGRYGRTLADEIGLEGASRRPQLVRVGWSAAITAVSLPVAVVALWLVTVAAPTLSVSATAGVLAGLGAVGVGSWLLLR